MNDNEPYEVTRARFQARLDDFSAKFVAVDAETLPNFMVWTEVDGQLHTLIASVWTWDEAIRLARGAAIIAADTTRVICLA